MSLVAWTQLEELKQQQKLDRQKEQNKKRKLETDPDVELSNTEPVKEELGQHKAKKARTSKQNPKRLYCQELKKVLWSRLGSTSGCEVYKTEESSFFFSWSGSWVLLSWKNSSASWLGLLHLAEGNIFKNKKAKKLILSHQVLVAAHRILSCSTWDLVPWPGIESEPSALGVGVQATEPPGKSPEIILEVLNFCMGTDPDMHDLHKWHLVLK